MAKELTEKDVAKFVAWYNKYEKELSLASFEVGETTIYFVSYDDGTITMKSLVELIALCGEEFSFEQGSDYSTDLDTECIGFTYRTEIMPKVTFCIYRNDK